MITVTIKRTTTVDGQSVTEEVTLTANFPTQDEEKIKQLNEQLHKTTESLKEAGERNKPQV